MAGEENHLMGRMKRYVKVGAGVSGVAARFAGDRLLGRDHNAEAGAAELKAVLGGLKGPLMKVAQIMSTIPDLVPPEYAQELSELQTQAPAMGWPFVRRRMKAELGADWQSKFQSFEKTAAAAASLGQVHKAVHPDGRPLACKLQYPDMQSAVEADLAQLELAMGLYRRLDGAIDPRELGAELAARLREELDYTREAAHLRLYELLFQNEPQIRVPGFAEDLSTGRLLTMDWLEGGRLLSYKDAPLEKRNEIARILFRAWWHPFANAGVIHGDPHLGNYTVFENEDVGLGINLLDFGCVRLFPVGFVEGVVDLYRALDKNDRDGTVAAYERWGFQGLSNELIDALTLWARFIFAPLLDDRVRTIADGIAPGEYGRREAFEVHQQLKVHGPVTPPREFVFMDRAAIGLGAVFLHLGAKLNFHTLFNTEIEGFETAQVEARQQELFAAACLETPDDFDLEMN